MSKIIETGTIRGRGYCIVEREAKNAWPFCLGGAFQLFGHGCPPSPWLCGYIDASDFDGVEYADPRLADLAEVADVTYSGRGVPNAGGAPETGWWLGVDTADEEGGDADTVRDTLAQLASALATIGLED